MLLQGVLGGLRGQVSPQLVDEVVDGHSFVRVEKQDGKQRPLLRAADRHALTLVHDFERTQEVELHRRASSTAADSGQAGVSQMSAARQPCTG